MNCLYFELLDWVTDENKTQSNILKIPMMEMENKNINEWKEFLSYNVKTNYNFDDVRQDIIPNGLKPEYTQESITKAVPLSSKFNPLVHYDLSQYLSKLVLLSHSVDDLFQKDIQYIFNIDKESNRNSDLGVLYKRGPVKLLERCKVKCQSDYRNKKFPTACHVLDIVSNFSNNLVF